MARQWTSASRFDDDDDDDTLDLGMRFIEYGKCSCQMMSKSLSAVCPYAYY